MVNNLLCIFLLIALYGCNVDTHRELDIQYPAKLVIKNQTQHLIALDGIYSSKEAKSPFLLKGEKLSAAENFETRISLPVFDDINNGNMWLEGQCGSHSEWKKKASKLSKNVIQSDLWVIVLTINSCGAE
ncbi:MAG: hypothetical protein MI864_05150 [Pseudomonadales bacterium]|uniref:Uncharacterized protein n=1 Tax=Oleiphilus messinensis TaxID=141451 RepID=A0A1Y0ICD5_9GAMM|nr:hypothetical protein [Oleiphilus messinensis]ARU57125.1 hypothetical protein OLMES_3082 [Oleiphilus messinensis]MCG8609904.1 hypothetical protein [Pseudomonadales bacterium]